MKLKSLTKKIVHTKNLKLKKRYFSVPKHTSNKI